MELKLDTSLARHYRGDRVLYIFGNVPYWFVANKQFEPLMSDLEKGIQSEEFFANLGPNTKSLIGDLIKNGVISQDGKKGDIERLVPNKRIWEVYDALELELTLDCNLRCKHCYIDAGKSRGNEISLSEIEKTLDDLQEMHKSDLRGKRVVLTGGEPFKRSDIIDIVDGIKERGFRTLINSNGLLIDDNHIQRLKGYDGLQICVSLDGLEESHEKIRGKRTYQPTLEAIAKLGDSGINTSINMLCHKGNYRELKDVVMETRDYNLQGINPVPVVLMGRVHQFGIEPVPEKDLYSELFSLVKSDHLFSQRLNRTSLLNFMGGLACNVKSHYCGTGSRGTYFVSHLGDVYPCPNMRFEQFKLGNIREVSFREITQDNPINSRLQSLSVDKMNDECPSCDVKYFCGGFCRGETYSNTGDINSPYVRCGEYKEGILEAMWELSANPELYEAKAKEFLENSKENGNK